MFAIVPEGLQLIIGFCSLLRELLCCTVLLFSYINLFFVIWENVIKTFVKQKEADRGVHGPLKVPGARG